MSSANLKSGANAYNYSYDLENRLRSATAGSTTIGIDYDPLRLERRRSWRLGRGTVQLHFKEPMSCTQVTSWDFGNSPAAIQNIGEGRACAN
jgi:hypothetical protein